MDIKPEPESIKILWIDEDNHYLEPFIAFLDKKGFAVEVCSSLSKGEELISRNNYALVILDIMIAPSEEEEKRDYNIQSSDNGTQSGLVFYRRVKSVLNDRKIKLLVLTQRLDLDVREKFFEEGLSKSAFARKADLPTVRLVLEKILSFLGRDN